MDFNIKKCGVMCVGKRNLELHYQMNDGWIQSVYVERDHGELISKDFKFSKRYLLAKNS